MPWRAAPTSPAPSWSAPPSPTLTFALVQGAEVALVAGRRAVRRVRVRAAREGPARAAGDPRSGPHPRALVHARQRRAADRRRRRVRPAVPAAARAAGGRGAVADPGRARRCCRSRSARSWRSRSCRRSRRAAARGPPCSVGLVLEAVGLVGVARRASAAAPLWLIPGLAVYGLGVGCGDRAAVRDRARRRAGCPQRPRLRDLVGGPAARRVARRRRCSALAFTTALAGTSEALADRPVQTVAALRASGQDGRSPAPATRSATAWSPPPSWPPRS